MGKRSEQEDDQPETNARDSTPQLDRLEKLANAAATAAQAKQWRARKNGIDQQEESSEVRNLSSDVEARARAEEAMRQMMAKPQSKRRGR
jgi:outer membrane murein-binding lipoprotein Lpp